MPNSEINCWRCFKAFWNYIYVYTRMRVGFRNLDVPECIYIRTHADKYLLWRKHQRKEACCGSITLKNQKVKGHGIGEAQNTKYWRKGRKLCRVSHMELKYFRVDLLCLSKGTFSWCTLLGICACAHWDDFAAFDLHHTQIYAKSLGFAIFSSTEMVSGLGFLCLQQSAEF